MKKKISTIITIGVFLAIAFIAGGFFESLRQDRQDITVKELAFEIEKHRWFFLNIDENWQLGFEKKYLKDSKGHSVKAWIIRKYKRTIKMKNYKEVADISIAGAGDEGVRQTWEGKDGH